MKNVLLTKLWSLFGASKPAAPTVFENRFPIEIHLGENRLGPMRRRLDLSFAPPSASHLLGNVEFFYYNIFCARVNPARPQKRGSFFGTMADGSPLYDRYPGWSDPNASDEINADFDWMISNIKQPHAIEITMILRSVIDAGGEEKKLVYYNPDSVLKL